MYSLYNLYEDLVRYRCRSSFQYNSNEFTVSFQRQGGFESCVVTYLDESKNRYRAFTKASRVTCMMDLHGMAACLLAEKQDLYFTPAGNFTSKELYSPAKSESDYKTPEEKLEKLINNVLDIDTDDKCFL